MSTIGYTVGVTLPDAATVQRWLDWMRGGHIAEVLAGGAVAAEIVQMDEPPLSFEVRVSISVARNVRQLCPRSPPRLRAEGLKLFPN